MPWFKVDDGFHSHVKPRRAGLAPIGLWAVSGSWSSNQAQDGFVPDWFIASWPQGRRHAATLVKVGLWKAGENDGESGWWFHDWEHFQLSKEEIARDRAHNRNRQKKFRENLRNAKEEGLRNAK